MTTALDLKALWPHQERGIERCIDAIRRGHRRIILACPTGGGKTRIAAEVTARSVQKGNRVAFATNRRLLTGQAVGAMEDMGIDFGVMARGWHYDPERPVQVISLPTIESRVARMKIWELPPAQVLFIDEAHLNTGNAALRVIEHYSREGAIIIGMTATPIGLGKKVVLNGEEVPLYTEIVVAGLNSELRACGALVACDVFAPDEPDMRGVSVTKWESKEGSQRYMETVVFANVFREYRTLNPFGEPALLFAPGVDESRWFAKMFREQGVTAESIEGDTSDGDRRSILNKHRDGEVKVICSCGVMREGVDLPWASHGILCQPCGKLGTFLQIVGRILRANPGKGKAVLQDHAGAWHRHGSPNADRQWRLEDTEKSIAKRVRGEMQNGTLPQGISCPKCHGIRKSGRICPFCQHEHVLSVRTVRLTDGTLERQTGDAVKKKRQFSEDEKVWKSCLYAAAKSNHTLAQAAQNFKRKTGKWLPDGIKDSPERGSLDWKRKAADVYPWLNRRASV